MTQDKLYKNKINRDAEFKKLKAEGYGVKKYSVRNQQIHPEYIEDELPELRKQTGFGNMVYNTFYSVLYGVKWC